MGRELVVSDNAIRKRIKTYRGKQKMNISKEIIMKSIPDYGYLYTIKEWEESCESGSFIDYDGWGDFATGTQVSNIEVSPSDYGTTQYEEMKKDFTHILWYNR